MTLEVYEKPLQMRNVLTKIYPMTKRGFCKLHCFLPQGRTMFISTKMSKRITSPRTDCESNLYLLSRRSTRSTLQITSNFCTISPLIWISIWVNIYINIYIWMKNKKLTIRSIESKFGKKSAMFDRSSDLMASRHQKVNFVHASVHRRYFPYRCRL